MTHVHPGCILITGSNGGLGSRLARSFLEAGFQNLACHYRSSSDAIAGLLREHGLDPERHLFKAELTDEAAIRTMREEVTAHLGSVWGLVNLAGGSSNGMSWKLPLAEFTRVLNANLVSTFLMTREFLPGMREGGGGRIINVSSVIAHTGIVGASHYCAAKAGIEGFTRAVAQEVAGKKITVNCLALGYFDQGIIADVPKELLDVVLGRVPVKRLGQASELHPLVSYLLSEQAGFLTGQVLHLNGGLYS